MVENIENQQEIGKKMETKEIITSLWDKLPIIVKDLIQKSQDLSDERNKKFFENPDDPLEHAPNWHQWGIITHTKMFEKIYHEEIPQYLQQWGVSDKVRLQMSKQIDGVSKDQLLNIAIIFHDLGKFTERKFKHKKTASFKNHELASGNIIRTSKFSRMLKQEYELTNLQIEYIARCAELHYELAIIRDEAKKSDSGYTLIFAKSVAFQDRAKQLIKQYPNFQLEVGLLYLADSLAKTDIRIQGNTDEQIESQNMSIQKTLNERGLNPKLIKAVKQLPINCAIVETYLKVWAETKSDPNFSNDLT